MEYPKRKHIRLKDYDYSRAGSYFVTVCVQDRRCLLSKVVGRGLAPAEIRLTACGRVAEEELLALMERYPMIRLDKYVIMPNHIHMLIRITQETAEASPRPTLMQAMAAWKSLSTRRWNRMTGNAGEKLWQQGYYEHIIRDDNDFMAHWTYIDQNPAGWSEDEYFGGTP